MSKLNVESHRRRLRQAFLAGLEEAFSETSLLELILTYAIPSSDVSLLAHDLLSRFGSLEGVLVADFESLCRVSGVKEYTATLLKLFQWFRAPSTEGPGWPILPAQEELFRPSASTGTAKLQKVGPAKKSASIPPTPGLFSPALLGEALQVLPLLPISNKIEEIKNSLLALLEYSAASTRSHYANCILRHMFPAGSPDKALITFAHHFAGTSELRTVGFYRLMKAQPLLLQVIQDLILPSLHRGGFTRVRLWGYLDERFPGARGVRPCAQAIVEALVAAGLAEADRKAVSVKTNPLTIPAFTFILHDEYPLPGKYPIVQLEENCYFLALRWKRHALLPALAELQERGIVADIPTGPQEMDEGDWFTTRYSLEQAVDRLLL